MNRPAKSGQVVPPLVIPRRSVACVIIPSSERGKEALAILLEALNAPRVRSVRVVERIAAVPAREESICTLFSKDGEPDP
jgi:hypothetical protein